MAGTGTLPEGSTNLSSIYFYAGVKLDPSEQRWYVKSPPKGFDLENGLISDYWTRAEFEKEVLEPYEVKKLAIPDSMFQNPGKQIYHPYPLSDFILTNVNFVKVVNKDQNGSKIFYGFISSVTYDNDGNTIIDWTTSEFYTNLFNGIKFNYAQISKAHNKLSDGSGKILDDIQYRVKENLSAGDTLIPEKAFKIVDDDKSAIRFWVCELYISKGNPTRNINDINIGYPSSRAYIALPFNRDDGYIYNIIDQTNTMVNGGIGHSNVTLGKLLLDLSVDMSWQASGLSIGQMGVTYSIGSDFTVDKAAKTIKLTTGNAKFGLLAATSGGYNLPVLNSAGVSSSFTYTYTGGLYKFLMDAIKNSDYGAQISAFFNPRGGIPEKLTHYVGLNFLDGDSLIGSFTGDEVKGSINDDMKIHLISSPHQFSRVDLMVEPYSAPHAKSSTPDIMRKFTNQRNSSIPFADNAWSTYSFLNQNQMQNAKNVINTSMDITKSQNQFNNSQAHQSAANNRALTQQGNSNSLEMTTQTANQQLGMTEVGAAVSIGQGGIKQAIGMFGKGSSLAAGAGGLLGEGLNKAPQVGMAMLQQQNTMANQGMANRQALGMTDLQNSQQLQLANNTLNFGNKIAAQTAEMKHATLRAGWNDMKLQPATVISGGSESEYLAHASWDYPTGVASVPTASVLMAVGRHLMEYGNEVNIYDKLQKHIFTRKVVNFIKTDDCSIAPSSHIENSVRLQLERAFDRGVQIWHNLDKMATMDYTGNDYA